MKEKPELWTTARGRKHKLSLEDRTDRRQEGTSRKF
jgi:hypothetical protein